MPDQAGFCPTCGAQVNRLPPAPGRGQPASYPGPYPQVPQPAQVAGIGTAAAALLGVVAAGHALQATLRLTGDGDMGGVGVLTTLLTLPLGIVFITWFYRVRLNAGRWGPQRRSPGWAIGAWFTPVVNLWFPYQIADDAYRASAAPGDTRGKASPLIVAWWVCWLLTWFSGFHLSTRSPPPQGSTSAWITVELGSTLVSNLFAAAAALCGLLVVRHITSLQNARLARPMSGRPAPAP